MIIDGVIVIEDGSLNGRVLHSRCLPSRKMQRHDLTISKAGRGHEKPRTTIQYNVEMLVP